jgi:hypothetical protein
MINNDILKDIIDSASTCARVQNAVIRSRVESLAEAAGTAWDLYGKYAIDVRHSSADSCMCVHLNEARFRAIYPDYTVVERHCSQYNYELSVMHGNVKIFAITEEE